MLIFNQYGVKKAILLRSYGKVAATKTSDVELLVDSGLHGLKFLGLSQRTFGMWWIKKLTFSHDKGISDYNPCLFHYKKNRIKA